MTTLLDQAKAAPSRKKISPEAVSAALGWVLGEVWPSAVSQIGGRKRSKLGRYTFLARALAQHVRVTGITARGPDGVQALSLAWARGEIGLHQVATVLSVKNYGSVYPKMARGLRDFLRPLLREARSEALALELRQPQATNASTQASKG